MKIYSLTNDNHMLIGIPEYCHQIYAGTLDIKRWGHLSALYEAQNTRIDEDIIGINVDGRMFDIKADAEDTNIESAVRGYLSEADMIVEPVCTFRGQYVSAQFVSCHVPSCLFYVYEAIYTIYPQYEDAFFQVMDGVDIHLHNTLITKKDIFYNYVNWLFDILFYVEKAMSWPAQNFILAYLPDRLLEVYIQYKRLKIKEIPCIKFK